MWTSCGAHAPASQSVKGADTVSAETRGYDGGKKINARKRHIVVDTIGLLLVVMVTAASVQDRDGGRGILKALSAALGSVRHIFADGGYRGQLVALAKSAWGIVIEVVKKPPPISRASRSYRGAGWWSAPSRGCCASGALARDYERLPASHESIVKWAMVALMLNRLAPPPGPKPWSSKKAST